ncbi:MAG: DUF4402 domain-containing protein [Gammaproteobacteria bacterium]
MLLAASALAAVPLHAQSIKPTTNMAFGRFAAGSGGAITVAHTGARTRSGGVILLPSTAAAAGFTLQVPANGKQLIITLPANGTASLVSGANSMALTNFVSSRANGSLASGVQPLNVGATLQVAPNQKPGNYSGTFHVLVEYQ